MRTKYLFIIYLAVFLPLSNCQSMPKNKNLPHHGNDGFQNNPPIKLPTLLDVLKWRIGRPSDQPKPTYKVVPDARKKLEYLKGENSITWIGHATVLLRLEGLTLLTDPFFSQYAFPVQFSGPERVVPPGIKLEELPPIDIVVISHNHYDHLDQPAVTKLAKLQPDALFLVPLRLKEWFLDQGITNVEELDWWQEKSFRNWNIIATPTHHWSRRSLFDTNETLWSGWAIKNKEFSFFFPGDTGYGPEFKKIGERLGPFDLAALPIGAYAPRWFMKSQHVNPEEAVKIHQDIGATSSLGIHWGTIYGLTDEPLDEPPQKLQEAIGKYQLEKGEFFILKHGESRKI
ncbi:MAG: MBL fold metallo-hydrolase [Proteobacteria bacterium]|nr:MBL fold metallo-hydrolase [Pseudomonadota bacterium]